MTHELATLSDEQLRQQALVFEQKISATLNNHVTIDGEVAR